MSLPDGRAKTIAALALFLAILYLCYFWQFQISLDDIRPHLPGFIDDQVKNVLKRLPPDKDKNLKLPMPEVKYQCDFYYDPVVNRGEFNATRWILNNTDKAISSSRTSSAQS